MRQNALSLQSSVVGRANLRTYIQAAKAAGFDCIEPTKIQLDYFFQAGYKAADIHELLGNLEISSVGWLSDIERRGGDEISLLREAEKLFDEIYKFMPSELICNEAFYMSGMDLELLKEKLGITVYSLDAWYFDDSICQRTLSEHFHVNGLEGLGLSDFDCGVIAAGALLKYLLETQKRDLSHITKLSVYATGKYMLLDSSTRRNLELCETLREKQKRGSLLWCWIRPRLPWGQGRCASILSSP